jgi:hypothetical protein
VGSDTINLINTLGFPIVSAAFAAVFGYKVVFYVLRDLSGEIKELHSIVVKLITEGLQLAVPAILAMFLRHGIAKTQDAAEAAVEAASSVTPAPKKKSAASKA